MNKLSTMTDYALAQLYENGTDEAFDVLLGRYSDTVYAYSLFLMKRTDDAEDIFQETFTRAIAAIRSHRYQHTGDFGAWLIRISHNLAIDYARKSAPLILTSQECIKKELLNDPSYIDEGHERCSIEHQNRALLKKMLSYLPLPQQEIINLRFYKNLSYREIAEKKGISINTALGRMRYAIINLRKMMKKHELDLVG